MRQRIRAVRNSENGFTLTELLIVIVILGVLAGIVVFGVSQFTSDAQTSACKADVKNVEVAVDAYHVKNNTWPALNDLVTGGYLKASPASAILIDSGTGAVSSTACP